MTDQNKDRLKPLSPSGLASPAKPNRIGGLTGLAGRIAAQQSAKQTASIDAAALPHRIALMLDSSGSMSGSAAAGEDDYVTGGLSKIERLREAVMHFLQSCDLSTTSLAIETFGADGNEHLVPQSTDYGLLMMSIMGLQSYGGTPMAQAMAYVLAHYAITRGIIVSDGQADSSTAALETVTQYAEAQVPIDCVHIGSASHGEDLLRKIAELTGGMYIKFTNVSNFAKSFAYLTPAKRSELMLHDGSERARLLGATEVK